jgi:LDH2 family malate/lactate/ureidoglycolate dehydrogenase
MELRRREHGIPVDASTWVELSEVAERFGLTMPTALADAVQG